MKKKNRVWNPVTLRWIRRDTRQLYVFDYIPELRVVMLGYCQPKFAPDEINKMLAEARFDDSSRCFIRDIKGLARMHEVHSRPGWTPLPLLN